MGVGDAVAAGIGGDDTGCVVAASAWDVAAGAQAANTRHRTAAGNRPRGITVSNLRPRTPTLAAALGRARLRASPPSVNVGGALGRLS